MEGKNTEPQYFTAFRKTIDGALVKLEFFSAAGCPMTIAQKASKAVKEAQRDSRQNSYSAKDQVWAIFDRDEHPKIDDALDLCRSTNIGLAYSNPCFELWLMLHKKNYGTVCSHKKMQRDLSELIPEYSRLKGKTLDFESLLVGLSDAEARAELQHRQRQADSDGKSPPFTTVYKLTKAIKAAEAAYKQKGG
jgi:hypothetical protein